MKKLVMLSAALFGAMSAFAAVELVRNVDMEAVDAGGSPVEWAGGPARWMKEENGNHFLRLVQSEPGKMSCVYRKHEIPEGCDRAAISFRARLSGFVRGDQPWFDARVIVNIKDKDGNTLASQPIFFNADTDGWTRREETIAFPAGAKFFEYMPALFNCKAGAFDFDDLRVTLLKPDEKVGKKVPKAKGRELPKVKARPLGERDALHVDGNRLLNAAGDEVWLQGVAICSLEWLADGDHIEDSFAWAIADWRANCIRLAVCTEFWFGEGKQHNARNDGGEGYRRLMDRLIDYANARGCYVAIDLHEYKAPTTRHAKFWTECAKRYANRPGVLFDILNEPHGISWREWRDGGELKDGGGRDEVNETGDGKVVNRSIGMQKLVETVRATGAKNVIIAGGLDWAYDCSGVMNGYELKDAAGNGIMYSVHVYPWKSDWKGKFLACAEKHPLFLGEVGCQPFKMPWESKLVDPYEWAPDVIACIQRHRLNWTAWSFHVSASPCVIADWDYNPTTCWGAFVRAALRGARFESDRLR